MRSTLSAAVVLTFGALIFPSGNVMAQSKIPVFVDATIDSQDHEGARLVYELKEAIRGSHGYRLITNRTEWPYVKMVIVATSAVIGGRKLGMAYSYSLVYDSTTSPFLGAFITSGVMVCPVKDITDCARGHMPDIERAVDVIRQNEPRLIPTLR